LKFNQNEKKQNIETWKRKREKTRLQNAIWIFISVRSFILTGKKEMKGSIEKGGPPKKVKEKERCIEREKIGKVHGYVGGGCCWVGSIYVCIMAR
jgi:hypothetical protein